MGEKPLTQSSPRRAWEDTKHSFYTIKFFLGVEVVAMGVFIFLATLLIPENASRLVSAGYPAVGAVIGAIVGFGIIYLVMLVKAPYRQRDEAHTLLRVKPKPKPLINREALLKVIMDVQNLAMELVNSQETLDNVNWMGKPLAQEAWGKAYQPYKHSLQDLDKELVVAGEAYESCVLRFKAFVQEQVWLKIAEPTQFGGDEPIALGKYEFPARLGEETKKAIRTINQISGQAPDKEGSQI